MKHLALLAAGTSTLVVGGLVIRALAAGSTVASLDVDSIVAPPEHAIHTTERRRSPGRPTLAEVASIPEPSPTYELAGTALDEARVPAGGPVESLPRADAAPPTEEALAAQERNENAAIATLRSIAAAQQQVQASGCVDTDADGGGEFAYFAELAGKSPLRIFSRGGPTVGSASDIADPTFLPLTFGNIQPGSNGGVAERQGYLFQIWLPGDETKRPIRGIAEAAYGGSANQLPGSSNAEIMWCCYAWPKSAGDAPARAFMINQSGDVLCTDAARKTYMGLQGGPSADAAFSAAGDIGSELGMQAAGLSAQDGNGWVPAGN